VTAATVTGIAAAAVVRPAETATPLFNTSRLVHLRIAPPIPNVASTLRSAPHLNGEYYTLQQTTSIGKWQIQHHLNFAICALLFELNFYPMAVKNAPRYP
jgi:hypothetical protein